MPDLDESPLGFASDSITCVAAEIVPFCAPVRPNPLTHYNVNEYDLTKQAWVKTKRTKVNYELQKYPKTNIMKQIAAVRMITNS